MCHWLYDTCFNPKDFSSVYKVIMSFVLSYYQSVISHAKMTFTCYLYTNPSQTPELNLTEHLWPIWQHSPYHLEKIVFILWVDSQNLQRRTMKLLWRNQETNNLLLCTFYICDLTSLCDIFLNFMSQSLCGTGGLLENIPSHLHEHE